MSELIKPEALLKLSVSKSKTFQDCKKKFKFNYIDRLPKKDWDHLTYGKFVHRALEAFHKFYLDGSTKHRHEEMQAAFKLAVEEFKDKLSREQKKEAFAALSLYLEKVGQQPFATPGQTDPKTGATILSVEKAFELPVQNRLTLIGFIDRIQLDPDGILHVCDYKTTKDKRYLKDMFQLLTYAYVLLLEDPTIKKVRGSYILIRHDWEYITQEFDVKQILDVEKKLIKYADDIESEKLYRANPTPLCKYCDYLESCDEGRKFVYRDSYHGPVSW
jgi:RecB family exonuclease